MGKFFVIVGLDDEYFIVVYDWENKKVFVNFKGDMKRIFNCKYNLYDGRIVIVGEQYVKFWVMENGYFVGKNGVFGCLGKLLIVLFIVFGEDGSIFIGMQYGIIYQWVDGGEECIQKFDFVYEGLVYDIFVIEDYIIIGGNDGKVNFFIQYMEKVFVIDMSKVVESIIDD